MVEKGHNLQKKPKYLSVFFVDYSPFYTNNHSKHHFFGLTEKLYCHDFILLN